MDKRGLSLTIILVIAIAVVGLFLIGVFIYLVVQAIPGDGNITEDGGTDGGSNEGGGVFACSDGNDNDGDGAIDLADFGCTGGNDNNEINDGNTQCSDGADNDGDGLIDQDDPNCLNYLDNIESSGGSNGNGNSNSNGSSETFGIELISPEEDALFGSNESILLNFSVNDPNGELERCWYNIDQGGNISVSDCDPGENTDTFDTTNGNHTIYVYANNSDGDVESDNHYFTVNTGGPIITLGSPDDNAYLNDDPVDFHYTPLDFDLDSCELWGDFTGTFEKNQTDSNPNNDADNFFSLSLTEGQYSWGVYCNDIEGNNASSENRTFFVDLTNPNLILIEPSQNYYDASEIEVLYDVADSSLTECSVYHNESGAGTPAVCDGIESFNLTDFLFDGNYVIFVEATDAASNSNSASRAIFVNIPCQFNNANWNVTNAFEGKDVELIVDGTDCSADAVNFSIYNNVTGILEDQFDNIPFVGDSITYVWTTPITGNVGSSKEVYYFNATLSRDASVMIKSNYLSVTRQVIRFSPEEAPLGFVLVIVWFVLIALIIITIVYIRRRYLDFKNYRS